MVGFVKFGYDDDDEGDDDDDDDDDDEWVKNYIVNKYYIIWKSL